MSSLTSNLSAFLDLQLFSVCKIYSNVACTRTVSGGSSRGRKVGKKEQIHPTKMVSGNFVKCFTVLILLNAFFFLVVNPRILDQVDPSSGECEEAFGVKVPARDLHRDGSRGGILLISRVLSAGITSGLLHHLVTTDDYPIHKSDYGYKLHVKGWKRLSTFTVWCWTLLTVYFGVVVFDAVLAIFFRQGKSESVWLPVLFEVCFCCAILVTLVVHFVLIPAARRKDAHRLSRLLGYRSLTLHYANTCLVLIEAALSGFPVVVSHVAFAVVFCDAYLFASFLWYMKYGVYYYFFLNYEKFRYVPVSYFVLFSVFGLLWLASSHITAAISAANFITTNVT